MKPLFIYYPKCSTCQKAVKWLKAQGVEVEMRDIVANKPTGEELAVWLPCSGLPVQKFFNTSGLVYKAMSLDGMIDLRLHHQTDHINGSVVIIFNPVNKEEGGRYNLSHDQKMIVDIYPN